MKKTIIISILLAAGAATYYFNQQTESTTKPRARPTPNVVVAKAEMQPIRDEVEALGTGKANESITVTPKVTDMVTELNFEDGQLVEKGQLLVRLQDREQIARVTVAKVKMKDHERELARISSLVTSQTVAALERDRLQTLIDTAKAELEQAESSLKDRRIRAPFSGRLGLRQVSQGSLVTPGTVITTLDDISTIKLDFSVPERFLQSLAIGKSVEASAVAFEGELFTGKVVSVDSRVNPITRAVMVRAEIANKDLRLLPGMLMKVKLIKQSRDALIIPEAAIIPIQKNHFVYLVNDENVVERRQVQIGLRKRGWVEIVGGVNVGEQVMVRGILKVRPGDTVKVQFSENFSFSQQAKVEPLV
ncbi:MULTISPECIES: efflux RND transporter periplasmic adaptor subunit [Shewanella]|uniref:Efflux RND transporter periplasmic adaptor subunit n=1 Tax=Shewanella marisflavi TaxID=260364 RepID=A0AAC9U022_9GAMM|nr:MULTISPECIES: efflux RND transporter periplasmic adaptor subunit [Shewanella]ASJ96903.1 MexH family multidrug efflux RND transporter periplasmic adaptor subunit [Shewanella marisflavi]MCL1041014.1 efflux RND transporter periplasmic adaptor subunit [Shewanella marisflavi]QDF75438.1 efflux RND transporter periplasmic adaptor subunit [Shewanella marisflavi]